MQLQFRNFDTLLLALTSGAIPPEVVAAPARAKSVDGGVIIVEPTRQLSRSARAALKQLGVAKARLARSALEESVGCWLELFDLARDASSTALSHSTAVLFELDGEEQLPELVTEMMRLGNDRQSYRHVTDGERIAVLLRIIDPPYYTLLRAIDRGHCGETDPDGGPTAFLERNPRVWIELGYQHPLADRIIPPAGKMVLISTPREWRYLNERPFDDVYQLVDFELPDAPSLWQEASPQRRFRVSLSLTSGGSDTAELWVLRDDPIGQVDRLVHEADDELLSRLAFAVGQQNGETTVVVRVRPSKQPPPILVLEGVGLRPYLGLPHVFVPCGQRLHPPLRRDAVTRLFGHQRNSITWLYPGEDGRFTPESLPDAAFRPLSDWVDYVLDCEREALTAWIDSHQFDFESYVCPDDKPRRDPKTPGKPRPQRDPAKQSRQEERVGKTDLDGAPSDVPVGESEPAGDEAVDAPPSEAAAPPNELQNRLQGLETEFLNLESPLDSRQRSGLWRQMARLNAELGHAHDATVCWSHGFWEVHQPTESALSIWTKCEAGGADFGPDQRQWLDQIVSDRSRLPKRGGLLAAQLARAAAAEAPPAALVERLDAIGRYLERHDVYLPIRVAWLAWVAYAKLSGSDVLALARARDRLLERMYRNGLQAELDIPSFLRTLGVADSERFRAIRERIGGLHERIRRWIYEPPGYAKSSRTGSYADMMFAYALARLGEVSRCRSLVDATREELNKKDLLHRWFFAAFEYRVQQALDGQSDRGQLKDEVLQRLAEMEKFDKYKADRFRQHSRILEPHERVDPYRNWRRHLDDMSRRISGLYDIHDREKLRREIVNLLGAAGKAGDGPDRQAWVLATAMELAPRLGDSFSADLLAAVGGLTQRKIEASGRQRLLAKALTVAAHFDRLEYVAGFVGQIYDSLKEMQIDQATESFEILLAECFGGLRKLGMRDHIGHLLGQVAELVRSREPRKMRKRDGRSDEERQGAPTRLLLLVASGWFYFGQQDTAMEILDEAREIILQNTLKPVEQTKLACAYVAALGNAPTETALSRLEELFETERPQKGKTRKEGRRLQRVEDSFTTSSHFSLSQLDVIESVVQTLVGDEVASDSESRRWLDEDEFLVRRRIHRDVREAMAESGTE